MGATPDEIPRELEPALTESTANAGRLKAVWSALGEVAPAESPPPGTEAAWLELEARLEAHPIARRTAGDRPARRLSGRRRWIAPVAMILLAAVVGVGWWLTPLDVRVSAGEQQIVSLPDGSTVEMNSATQLRHRRAFATVPFVERAERRVNLTGEAYFDVVADGRPFVVVTADAVVEVLGTRFNVRARPTYGGTRTVVTLEEGRLRIHPTASEALPWMVDSTGAVAVARTGMTRLAGAEAALDHVLAWRSQGFAVVNEPIGDILHEVRRRFAVDVRVEGQLAVDAPMTVLYPRGATAEQIIHDVCLARGWRYRETSRGFALFIASGGSGSGVQGE